MAAAWNRVAISWELKICFIKLNTQSLFLQIWIGKIFVLKGWKVLKIYNAIIETNKNEQSVSRFGYAQFGYYKF